MKKYIQKKLVEIKRKKVMTLFQKLKDMEVPILMLDKIKEAYGWTESGTALVFDEYLKFVALTSLKKRVVPSLSIDEVWHTHLTFTKNYWDRMCEKVLLFKLHHNPSGLTPSPSDQKDYEKTLKTYEEIFQVIPPVEVWGCNTMKSLAQDFN